MTRVLKELPRTWVDRRKVGVATSVSPRLAASPKAALAALAVLLATPLVVGAWRGFPVYDDAYFVQFLRELGPSSIAADHPDRPAYGLLLQGIGALLGLSRAPYVAVGLASWLLLAWQTGRLWRRTFRERPELAPIPALLVLSPILVDTQFTTVTTVIPVQLPVSLALGGLLLGLRSPEREIRWLPVGVALVFLGGFLSEYALATILAGAALLAVRRRFRPAIALLSGGAVGELARHVFAKAAGREDTIPGTLLGVALHEPLRIALNWISGIWQSLAGLWFSAAGAVRLGGGSGSTLLAAAAAVAAGVLAARWSRSTRAVRDAEPRVLTASILAPCAGVAAGLLLVVLAVRSATLTDYGSRFRTPILPFATVAFVAIVYRSLYARWRPFVFALLFFVAEFRAVDRSFAIARDQARLTRLGTVLQPLVAASRGISAAVFPSPPSVDGGDLTPKVTRSWSAADARRAWVMTPLEAEDVFGSRAACRDTTRIDLPRQLHFPPRHGALSHLLWIPASGDAIGTPEPYCLPPGSASRSEGTPLAGEPSETSRRN